MKKESPEFTTARLRVSPILFSSAFRPFTRYFSVSSSQVSHCVLDFSRNTKNAPKKGSTIGSGNIVAIQHDPNAVPIVSLLRQTMNKYYALIDDKDGLQMNLSVLHG